MQSNFNLTSPAFLLLLCFLLLLLLLFLDNRFSIAKLRNAGGGFLNSRPLSAFFIPVLQWVRAWRFFFYFRRPFVAPVIMFYEEICVGRWAREAGREFLNFGFDWCSNWLFGGFWKLHVLFGLSGLSWLACSSLVCSRVCWFYILVLVM